MKLIIAGSRHLEVPVEFITQMIQKNGINQVTEVVSGGAKGIDASGEAWAKAHNIPIKAFPANWEANGRAAGPIRNREMAKYSDCLLALWDGNSSGTKNMIEQMYKLHKPVKVEIVERIIDVESKSQETSGTRSDT